MGIYCIARNVIDQIGLEDYRLASDVDREETEARGENLVELLGVLLRMEDRNSRSLRSLRQTKFGKKKGGGDCCASSQSHAANKEVPPGEVHCATPNADRAHV